MIKVDGLLLRHGRLVDQLIGGAIVETKAPLDDGMEFVMLGLRHIAVDGGGVHEQCRCRQAVVVIGELAGMSVAIDEFGDEVPERVKHRTFQLPGMSFPRSYRVVKRTVQASMGLGARRWVTPRRRPSPRPGRARIFAAQ